MIEEKVFDNLKYLVCYPDGFSADKKYPLVVFLHGAGTRSENTELLRRNVSFLNIQKRQSRGFVLLAPLCHVTNWNETMPSLVNLVDSIRNLEFIDIKRVYLTGNSMGGYGTWELSSLHPDWFAAAMPVCGGGIPWLSYKLTDLPVRTFHGLCDKVVDPIESLEMVKAVNRRGGYAELILFPSLEHNCWERVYTTEENYDWLFSFTTDRDKKVIEQLSGSCFG
ncbi:MAG: phospholipase [Clostridia bacterium]|nr:phospholipase [Clostridia bacterium]